MTNIRPHIVFLGEVGFPLGFGAIQRQLLLAQGILKAGSKVTVISFKGIHGSEQKIFPRGTFQGIDYHYTSGSIYRPDSFIKRNWMKVVGRFHELRYIRKIHRSGHLTACYVSTSKIQRIFLYWMWLKFLGVPLILNYDEMMSSIPTPLRVRRWNDRLFDRFAVQFSDAVTPISEYITSHVKTLDPKIPTLKVPILCDFEKFNPTEINGEEISLTYCGAASYSELISFVLGAFDLIDVQNKKIFLDFILGGNRTDLDWIRTETLATKNRAQVRIHANVPHDQIPTHYAKASALLIPLRPTVQDAARFPHKLGEYLASGRPVITTRFGEIRHYDFIDEQTALVAARYDIPLFAAKMKFVIDHPHRAHSIGLAGREMGLANFDYKKIGNQLNDFILSVSQNGTYVPR
ncbi:MAG: glycosyltransferase [Saprospiraceae bacterium]|nr:glycosyltransferase [Saprospiraceae bacterium]